MAKDILLPLRLWHGKHIEKKEIVNECKKWLHTPPKNNIYLIGTPEHANIGDSAIALAELIFIEKISSKAIIKDISVEEYDNIKKKSIANDYILSHIKSNGLVVAHGGGNMGNQWYDEELFRQKFMSEFSKNPVIIFPQTIFYSNDKNGLETSRASKKIYNDRVNCVMVAREKQSYDIMKSLYPDADILLTPDIVLSINPTDFDIDYSKREKIMLCFRNDFEKNIQDNEINDFMKFLSENNLEYFETDMYYKWAIKKHMRYSVVKGKLEQFASAKLVVTDRLHGMVFSALTGTPCIVMSNYNHKVKGTYDWISYLPYIKYANNIEEAKSFIPDLLNIGDCKFDNTPLTPYFDKLAEVVRKYV